MILVRGFCTELQAWKGKMMVILDRRENCLRNPLFFSHPILELAKPPNFFPLRQSVQGFLGFWS